MSRLIDTKQLLDSLPLGLATADHMVAIISNSLNNKISRAHLFSDTLVSDIVNIIVNLIELVAPKIRNKACLQVIAESTLRS